MNALQDQIEVKYSRSWSTSVPFRLAMWSRLEKKWGQIQVGHQGSYSVERLELLHEYCQAASFTRVVMVCALTPVPALLVVILLECLPLRSPTQGWAANWMFWVRVWFMLYLVTVAGACQLNLFVPEHRYSLRKLFISSIMVSVAQLGTFIAAAAVVGFPVPFMWQFGAITMGIYVPVLTRFVVGPPDPSLEQLHANFRDSFAVNLALTAVYPFCRVLYDLLPPAYRVLVVIILPLWKFGAKRFAVRMTRQVQDFIPELVAFSVDFLGSLFISVCMSTSGSFHLTAIVIGFDVLHSIRKFREIGSSEKVILQIMQARAPSGSSPTKTKLFHQNTDSTGLLAVVLETIHSFRTNNAGPLQGVRLWASPPHIVSRQMYGHLQRLEKSGVFGPRNKPEITRTFFSDSSSLCCTSFTFRRTSVAPIHIVPTPVCTFISDGASGNEDGQSDELVPHILQLLFHCEYIVLVEYVECVVPFMFMIYKTALEQLPNVVYYPGGSGRWGATAMINLAVFVVLEVASLILVHLFIRNKFAFSPLYQLAFVLETQFYAVQATLLSLTIFLLQYQLAHLGPCARMSVCVWDVETF